MHKMISCFLFSLVLQLGAQEMDYHFTSKNCRIEGGQLQYTEGINSPAGVFFGKRKAVFNWTTS